MLENGRIRVQLETRKGEFFDFKPENCSIVSKLSPSDENAVQASLSDVVEIDAPKKHKRTYAQDEISSKIALMEAELVGFVARKNMNMLSLEQLNTMRQQQDQVDNLKKKLRGIRNNASYRRQKEFQERQRNKKQRLIDLVPSAAEILNMKGGPGRPPVEDTFPELYTTILNIALHKQLTNLGFVLKRSTTYLRLMPRRVSSIEGKKHVRALPVKLIRAQNNKHKSHPDGRFCTATIHMTEELASVLGPRNVFFGSFDDKARVAIGITAANKQAPLLMHLKSRVQLPDHDWVVAKKHKLSTSVHAGIKIDSNGMGNKDAVSYSGPT